MVKWDLIKLKKSDVMVHSIKKKIAMETILFLY